MNKRQEVRIDCEKQIKVKSSNESTMSMTALNYSMKGVGITGTIYQAIPHVGEELNINFTLDSDSERKVNVTGIVKYINLDGGAFYLGLGL